MDFQLNARSISSKEDPETELAKAVMNLIVAATAWKQVGLCHWIKRKTIISYGVLMLSLN